MVIIIPIAPALLANILWAASGLSPSIPKVIKVSISTEQINIPKLTLSAMNKWVSLALFMFIDYMVYLTYKKIYYQFKTFTLGYADRFGPIRQTVVFGLELDY